MHYKIFSLLILFSNYSHASDKTKESISLSSDSVKIALQKKAATIKNHPDCLIAKKADPFGPDTCFVLHHVANATIEKQGCLGLNLAQVDGFINDLQEHNNKALCAIIASKYHCWDEVKSLERECKRRAWDDARQHEIYMNGKYPFWNELLKVAVQKDRNKKN